MSRAGDVRDGIAECPSERPGDHFESLGRYARPELPRELALAGGVEDRLGHEGHIAAIEADAGFSEPDGDVFGEARGDAEDLFLAAGAGAFAGVQRGGSGFPVDDGELGAGA